MPAPEDPTASEAYEIDPELRLVLLRGPPPQEFEAWKAMMEKVLADPRTEGCNFLSDRRGHMPATALDVAKQVVEYLKGRETQFAGRRWAVVTDDPAHYGTTRMVAGLTTESSLAMRAFHDYDSALAWLEAPAIDQL